MWRHKLENTEDALRLGGNARELLFAELSVAAAGSFRDLKLHASDLEVLASGCFPKPVTSRA
jgi:hypothetical protein